MPKTSQLPADSLPSGTDYVIALDTETNTVKKVLLSDIVALVGNTLATTWATRRTTLLNEVSAASQTITSASGMTNVTNFTSIAFTSYGGDLVFHLDFSFWRATSGTESLFRLNINSGASYLPNSTGSSFYTNELSSHKFMGRSFLLSGLAAGSHTVTLQGQAVSSGDLKFDTADRFNLIMVEYQH